MPVRQASELAVAGNQREASEFSSWFAVVRTYEECARRYTSMLEHFDLSVSQFDALVAIKTLGEAALPKAVADRLLVTRANVSGLLRRLEEHGLIKLSPHESDGRSLRCSLTAEGQELTARAQAAAARFVRAQLAPFPTTALDAMEAQMRSMYAHLQKLDPAALAAGDPQTLTGKASLTTSHKTSR